MAENDWRKELQAELKKLQHSREQQDFVVESRMDKIESSIEEIARAITHLVTDRAAGQHESASGSSNHGANTLGHSKLAKIDFPRFNGTDPLNWIFRAEQYFDYYDTPENQRVVLASVNMEGDVVAWFQLMKKTNQVPTWAALSRAIEMHYGPTEFENPRAQLLRLTQVGSVQEYHTRFMVLANRVEGLSEGALLDCFVCGLRDEIRREVISREPTTLSKAAALARLLGEKNNHNWGFLRNRNVQTGSNTRFSGSTVVSASTSATVKPGSGAIIPAPSSARATLPPLLPKPNAQPLTPVKRLTPAEIQLKREKGLCYTCDEKFTPNHKCQNRQYLLMQCEPDEESKESGEQDTQSEKLEEQDDALELLHLSLQAMQGAPGKCTILFQGEILGTDVSVFLDGGSSDNFIRPRIVKHLKLCEEKLHGFKVLVGGGQFLKGNTRVRDIPLMITGTRITVSALVLDATQYDVVLGAEWLATLGEHISDYSTATLKILENGQWITLRGDCNRLPKGAHFHQLLRFCETGAIEELYTMECRVIAECKGSSLKTPDDIPSDLQKLLCKYQGVFQIPKGLPPPRSHDHAISLQPGVPPVKVKPYRYPFCQKNQIELMVNEMLQEGIIRPSNSPYSAPVLLVKKKDGSWRFCTDYRALNAVTVKDSFPIPSVDELLDELKGACFFSKLDLRSGYHQILVKEDDIAKTAFRTPQGHYEWLVMPFGLTNAPATFQSLMNEVFKAYLRQFVLVFFDDILVYSSDWAKHLQHLDLVLARLLDNQLYAKLSKCSFGQPKMHYLGHVVSAQGVEVDQEKVIAVINWPMPTNVSQLRGFLGLTGYYRRFIRRYASIACPLTTLLKKNNFQWTEEAQLAFDHLKTALIQAPILVLPDFTKPFVVETDASGGGIGAVLSQDEHPIAYFSKKLSLRMQAQSTYVRELYAITEAVAKFRHYLIGHYFIIRTDQKSLKHLSEQTIQTLEQEAWLPKLLGFNYTIEYKPGSMNQAADALSRCCHVAITLPQSTIVSEIKEAVKQSEELQPLLLQVAQKSELQSEYQEKEGLLYWRGRLVIPHTATVIINKLLEEFHSSTQGGHAGFTRTMARVATYFFWTHMRKHIKAYIRKCQVCQRAKVSQLHPSGLLSPLPIPQQIWEDVAMDFITGLPNSKGYTVIMVVVDRLSKSGHFTPLRGNYNAFQVAEAFIQTVVKLHGIPNSIVSDRDKVFTSTFWRQLFKLQGTTLKMSSAYHPQTDGQSEALNRCLEMYLRCFVFETPKLWVNYLPWAEYWYNTSYQSSIGMTPFKAVFGREPPPIIRGVFPQEVPSEVLTQLRERDAILDILKFNLEKAQVRMKKFADRRRVEVQFQEGDLVFVKLQPYRQHSVHWRRNQKLSLRYFGPFEVAERIGSVAYRLKLPEEAKIHPVFHVSVLKKCEGLPSEMYLPLPLLSVEQGPIMSPMKILKQRVVQVSGNNEQQFLIQWDIDVPPTWELQSYLQKYYPGFDLEDKVNFNGEGNVMTTNQEAGHTEQAPAEVVTNDEVAEVVTNDEVAENDENGMKGQVSNDPHGNECQKVVVRRSNRARKKSLKVRENEGI